MRSQPSKPGLTRVEVVVIILCLLMLGALLLPAIQSTGERRPGPRQMCNNNLKGIVLALQAYHEYHRTFPMGAMHAGVSPGGDPPIDVTLGPSWWFSSSSAWAPTNRAKPTRRPKSTASSSL